MGDLSFPSFPAGSAWKMPLFWLETDPSQAGSGEQELYELYVGQTFAAGLATVASKASGNTGTGILTLDANAGVTAAAVLGKYRLIFTSATAFNVQNPAATVVGTGTAGAAFAGPIAFTVTTGGTAFVSGDEFDVTVLALPQVGAAPYNVPVAVASLEQAGNFCGIGSMLYQMFTRAFALNPAGVKILLPIPDPAGAVATGSIIVAQAQTSNGILSLYIAGQRCPVSIDDDYTPGESATAIALAINQIATLPVRAAVDGINPAKVNLTAKWKGATANDIDVRLNYRGTLGAESTPVGMVLTIVEPNGGTGTPDMTAAIAALGDNAYEFVGQPYSDDVTLSAWDQEYGFGANGRWGWMRQLYGSVYSARRDTFSNLFAWGPQHNSPVISVMAVEPDSPSPVWEWTAAYTARAAVGLLEDPARPLQTLEMTGVLPAPKNTRFNLTEANGLAGCGLAVQQTGPNGYPQISAEYTQWQVNAYGAADSAFALVTTLATLASLYRRFKQAITSKYPRSKLANNGTKFAAGQAIVTPNVIKAEIIAEYAQAEYEGLVENSDAFIKNLIVRRNSANPNRLDVLYPPDLVNGLRIFAVLSQFRLQYPETFQDVGL